MGRPTKLTPAVQQRICDAIAAGNYANVSAQAAGIDEFTFHEWMARGKGTDSRPCTPLYAQFAQAVKEAEATAELKYLKIIEKAAVTSWQAAAWVLERRHPAQWARRDYVDVNVVRKEAARLAEEHGIDAQTLIRQAEELVRRGS